MKSFVFALFALLLQVCLAAAQAPAGTRPTPLPPGSIPESTNTKTRIGGGTGDSGSAVTPTSREPIPNKPGSTYIPRGQEQPQQPNGLMTLWNLMTRAGWVMIPLAVMSFLAVMFILIFLMTLRRSTILTAHYMNTADVLLKKRDYLGLLAISSRHGEIIARVVQRTLDFATKNPSASFEVVRDVAESEGSSQASSLQHRVTYLADIGTLSPMVGLFGTVVGIVRSFGELGSAASKVADRNVEMADGVSQALIATGAGLVIGIVAFMFFAYFRNKVQRLISDLEVASAHIVGLMALNYKKREPSRAALEEEY
jgi:biopolymer transport protein ExbB